MLGRKKQMAKHFKGFRSISCVIFIFGRNPASVNGAAAAGMGVQNSVNEELAAVKRLL